jgi:alkylated DNA repair dioxygenase AlkB
MDVREAGQSTLFEDEPAGLPGLQYVRDFISREYEQHLIDVIETLPLREADYRGFTAKRRIVSYGAGYDFAANRLRSAPPIPGFLQPLRSAVAAHLNLLPSAIEHALVTEYRPGTALGWHRDVPEFGTVAGLSLGTDCRMRFRPYPPKGLRRADVVTLDLAPRSLYVLGNEARWRWQHSIPPTPGLRYSITLRTMSKPT